MTLTVIENAYLRIAEKNPNFSETHKKVLLALIHKKKHYSKDELLCLAENSLAKLEEVLKDLVKCCLIKVEGWLISLNEFEIVLQQTLVLEEPIAARRKRI